ncbi:MAG: hypothetical protein N2662_02645 [Bacteroidales bacterium]|nr:hypothetical protein [Bacteroidales bacterium]
MKLLYTIMFLAYINVLFAQKIEVFGGACYNIFHDYNKNEGHYMSSYKSEFGYSSGFGIDSITIDKIPFRFTLQLDKYGGKIDVSDGGLGGGYKTVATVDKLIISLGIFPVNLMIFKKIEINIGLIISRLIDETFIGTSSGWMLNQPSWSYNLHDIYDRFSSSTYTGLQGRIACDFKAFKSVWITPQYFYYYGISDEFTKLDTKSKRHYIGIGIKKRIK